VTRATGLTLSTMSPEPILLYRIEPQKRMYRRYSLRVEPALFGTALVRNFGSLGRPGRDLIQLFASHEDAESAHRTLLRRKLRRGYRLADPT
jgi:predicted DNA-binding WGR domain protein